LGADARDVTTVRTKKKFKRKKRMYDGNGPAGGDTVTIVSELDEEVYRFSFPKVRRVDEFDLVPFGYIKKEQSSSPSQYVS